MVSIYKERVLGCGDLLLENGWVYYCVRNKKCLRIFIGGWEINKEYDFMDWSLVNLKLFEVFLMVIG